MKIIFTLCSVNYLAQAHTLGMSLAKHCPEVHFKIGLVDRLDSKQINSDLLPPFEIIEVHKIGIQDFQGMCDRYDITELNTAVKPYFIHYFFYQNPTVESVIYLDPDIIVFDDLSGIYQNLGKHAIMLTPHILTPYRDNKWQSETDLVKSGIYNLGFIGVSRKPEGLRFVRWWMQKLVHGAKNDLCQGLFTDQHWIDFVPIFFDQVTIDRDPAYNVAYWNLHERFMSKKEECWYVNDVYPLHFFHYSGYNPFKSDIVSKYQDRIQFSDRPDIRELFDYYGNQLIAHHQAYWQEFPCDYIKPKKPKRFLRVRKLFLKPIQWGLNQVQPS